MLNQLREKRGLNTLTFKPHCGEAGQRDHLASAFLLSDSINHGIKVHENPVLQYLFYICQIGMALCPLSNDSLFLKLKDSPIGHFHKVGMNISINTDDPLQFHNSQDPILEEYLIAGKCFDMDTTDLCEIARNSVKMSNFDHEIKAQWLGNDYWKPLSNESNMPNKTNISWIRTDFRSNSLEREWNYINRRAQLTEASDKYDHANFYYANAVPISSFTPFNNNNNNNNNSNNNNNNNNY